MAKKSLTTVESMYKAKDYSEAGLGTQAFVHTLYMGKVRLTAKVIRSAKGLFAVPPSSKVGENWYSNFLFVDRSTADAWAEEAINYFKKGKFSKSKKS